MDRQTQQEIKELENQLRGLENQNGVSADERDRLLDRLRRIKEMAAHGQ